MRLSSRSIISPGRHLRSGGDTRAGSGAILGSPMFGGNGSRKRSGSGFEGNPEPSSPKVTCIGQVRVKTRKHMQKKMRAARSMRKRKGGGETSFRRSAADQSHGFDRFVHLPVAICESLRSFGSEINCFFPCRSSCTDGESKPPENSECQGRSSCGAAFVAVEETPGGKRREIELVVGCGDVEEYDDRRRSQRRRHVFDSIDLGEIEAKAEKNKEHDEEEEARFVPPKNALLLMRCRSNPMKAAAFLNRVRECSASQKNGGKEDDEDINEDKEEEERRRFELKMEDKKRIELCQNWISDESIAESTEVETNLFLRREKAEEQNNEVEEEEAKVRESVEADEVHEDLYDKEIEVQFISKIEDDLRDSLEEDEVETGDCTQAAEESGGGHKEEEKTATETLNQEKTEHEIPKKPDLDTCQKKERPSYLVLPEGLLLMMCEPKLSMEVSKETWVRKTDFVRWLPEAPPPPPPLAGAADQTDSDGSIDQPKMLTGTATLGTNKASSKRSSADRPPVSTATNLVPLQPPRSSCSYPAAAPPLLVVAEQKVGGYEPVLLTRCKSEPRRSAAAKLAVPEACFWKNGKLVEPHRPATLGFGAAGVGF